MKKMALVEKAILDRLREKQITAAIVQPELTNMVKIQTQIEEILTSSQLSAEEKLNLLQRAEAKIEKLKDSLHPQLLKVQAEPVVPPAAEPAGPTRAAPKTVEAGVATDARITEEQGVGPEPTNIFQELVMHPTYQAKYNAFQEALAQHPRLIQKNANDEILINNRRIPGSNFQHLIRQLYKPSHQHNLTGLPQLVTALKSINLDPEYISNKSIKEAWLGTPILSTATSSTAPAPPQKGQGKPPGKCPRVLYLYR